MSNFSSFRAKDRIGRVVGDEPKAFRKLGSRDREQSFVDDTWTGFRRAVISSKEGVMCFDFFGTERENFELVRGCLAVSRLRSTCSWLSRLIGELTTRSSGFAAATSNVENSNSNPRGEIGQCGDSMETSGMDITIVAVHGGSLTLDRKRARRSTVPRFRCD